MTQAPTRLKKSRDTVRRSLQERIDQALGIANHIRSQQEWDRAVAREKLWREYNVHLLETLFTTPEYADEYSNSKLPLGSAADVYYDRSFETLKARLVASVGSQIGKLQSIINRLELVEEESAAPRSGQPPDKANWLVALAERFHLVALQMRKRHADRSPFEIKDEHDVQDLIHGLLHIFFDDIRPEEWTPSYAGGAVKMDFLLPELKAALELKKMRPSLTTKALGEELLIDISKYQKHQDCRTLYCLVYDPEHLIQNPRGIEADLSGQHGDLVVRVMIVPKGT